METGGPSYQEDLRRCVSSETSCKMTLSDKAFYSNYPSGHPFLMLYSGWKFFLLVNQAESAPSCWAFCFTSLPTAGLLESRYPQRLKLDLD